MIKKFSNDIDSPIRWNMLFNRVTEIVLKNHYRRKLPDGINIIKAVNEQPGDDIGILRSIGFIFDHRMIGIRIKQDKFYRERKKRRNQYQAKRYRKENCEYPVNKGDICFQFINLSL